jgi:hypothetical protein
VGNSFGDHKNEGSAAARISLDCISSDLRSGKQFVAMNAVSIRSKFTSGGY